MSEPGSNRYRVLMVEDTEALARTYMGFLRTEGYDIRHVMLGAEGLTQIAEWKPHALLLDVRLPDMTGIEILEKIFNQPDKPATIVITGDGSINTAIDAMRLGAVDFLAKPFTSNRLIVTLANALKTRALEEKVVAYREVVEDRHSFEGMIGSSLPMQAVYKTIEAAAASKASVFITGESGTGKELCAEALHARSPRANGPLIALNCAAIPKDLIESEIFGHVKGAFTGAVSDKPGAAMAANGGTLFLDEICEMDPFLQSKLLRFIQTGTVTRVGESEPRTVDVRFVCATNRDPLTEVREGRFREDLYYRLHVLPIDLPALREREGDVMEIAQALLARAAQEEGKSFTRFSDDGETAIRRYSWPGNIRELQNAIRNAVVMHDGTELTAGMLPIAPRKSPREEAREKSASAAAATEALEPVAKLDMRALSEQIQPLEKLERNAIQQALALCQGDVQTAAVLLGISPATLYRKKKSWVPAN